jgi:hypothetical protein
MNTLGRFARPYKSFAAVMVLAVSCATVGETSIVGHKARGKLARNPEAGSAKSDQYDYSGRTLAENRRGESHITVVGPLERTVEPVEELSEQPFPAFWFRLEKQGGKRGAASRSTRGYTRDSSII